MRKARSSWSQKQTDEKVLSVISSICSISIIIFVCTQILGVWKTEVDLVVPLFGVAMLIEVIQNWKKNKKIAKGCLFAVILALVDSILQFVMR